MRVARETPPRLPFRAVIPAKAGIRTGVTRQDAFPRRPFPISTPSFPRRRESRRLKTSRQSEIKRESQSSDPFSFYGLTGVG